jgi:hypothetical protein
VEGNTLGLGAGHLLTLRPGPGGSDVLLFWNPDDFGNEIRFEDKKGEEELHVQAEKDMSTLVKWKGTPESAACAGVFHHRGHREHGGPEKVRFSGSRSETLPFSSLSVPSVSSAVKDPEIGRLSDRSVL